MQELRPGTFTRVFAQVEAAGRAKTRVALGDVARLMERDAKQLLRTSTHPYGTVTPAVVGGPPSLISGTLRRSVTHDPISWVSGAWQTRVGTARGFYPPYGGARRTGSSMYGKYLETGLRNGARYPWLSTAYRQVLTLEAPRIWRTVYRGRW